MSQKRMDPAEISMRQPPGLRTGLSALTVMVLATAGCGGGSGHQDQQIALGKAFQMKATAVCQAALTEKKAQGPFPFPDFNPTRPDRSKLPEIGRLDVKTVRIYKTWLHGWMALGQPPRGQVAWAQLVRTLRTNLRIIADQGAAGLRGDARRFTKDYYVGGKAQQEVELRSRTIGLPVCAAASAV